MPRVYGSASPDPVGSVSVIDVATRTVIATADFAGVPVMGSNVRTATGMDFEPEYITVSHQRRAVWPAEFDPEVE